MCGVPVHAAEQYLEKLIRKGFRVAVCEQTEDPAEARKRGAKSVVAREVVRLVTPGTLTEDSLLEARAANILAALGRAGGDFALASADMSAGEFRVGAVAAADLAAELARLAPREVLAPDGLLADETLGPLLKSLGPALTPLPSIKFDSAAGERALKALYKVAALDAFGSFSRAELSAAGSLVGYLELTQKGKLPALKPLVQTAPRAFMAHRCGHPPQSRTGRDPDGRAPRLAAGRHRPHGDGGRRARAGRAAGLAADRSGRRSRPATTPSAFFVARGRIACRSARGLAPRARYRPRRWRGCRSAVAARAIWRPCATG